MNFDSFTQELFFDYYTKIEEIRKKQLLENANSQTKKELYENGISIVKDVFDKETLCDLINFQNSIEVGLKNNFDCGGYINCSIAKNNLYVNLQKVHPNHGQIRVQTKSLPFEMPGFRKLSSNPFLKEIFSWWHQDAGEITRGTMEWIIPSEINHNGWHKDVVRPQLKAFVLLGDVDIDTAPMFYAKKSHFIQNDFEKEVAYRMFKSGTNTIANNLTRKGKHFVGIKGGHAGFLSDDEAKNDPDHLDYEPIILGGQKYEKFVCTGNIGDVVFFDSCGFHSGNRAHSKIRRTISLSSPGNMSKLAIAFDNVGAKTV